VVDQRTAWRDELREAVDSVCGSEREVACVVAAKRDVVDGQSALSSVVDRQGNGCTLLEVCRCRERHRRRNNAYSRLTYPVAGKRNVLRARAGVVNNLQS